MKQQICDPDRLDAFVQGELGAEAERELTSHLDDCAACGQSLEDRVAEASAWSEASDFLGGGDAFDHAGLISDFQESRGAQIQQVLAQLAPTDDPESLGRIGGYEVTGVIGSGGMGVVLKAHDRPLDRVVAVKIMAPHLATSGSARQRFAREAKAAAAVLHPNVIAIHGVSDDLSLPYLVMPYVPGSSLQKRIDTDGPLPTVDILRIGSQVAAGLAAAHDQGLVHRDIKPANILLEQGIERVTITDFGLARAVDDASMTRSGVIAGTPQYMSPEQARGEPIDHRSDLFSLGSLLYAMCTGHSPFRAETSFGVLHRITHDSMRPIRELNSDIPLWLEAIVMKLLSKPQSDRFDSAQSVADVLEDCLAHVQHPSATPLPKRVEQLQVSARKEVLPRRKRTSHGWLIGLVAFGFCMIAGIAARTIVLETAKGTIRIETNSEIPVPVLIRQGDEVVDELTVSQTGTSVRLRAGNYVIEVNGDKTGITIKGDEVRLSRGGMWLATVTADASELANTSAENGAEAESGQAQIDLLQQRVNALKASVLAKVHDRDSARAILSSLETQLELQRKLEKQTVASLDSLIQAAEQRVDAEKKVIAKSDASITAEKAELEKVMAESDESSSAYRRAQRTIEGYERSRAFKQRPAKKRLSTAQDELMALRNKRESESLRLQGATAQVEAEWAKARGRLIKIDSELQASEGELGKSEEQLKRLQSVAVRMDGKFKKVVSDVSVVRNTETEAEAQTSQAQIDLLKQRVNAVKASVLASVNGRDSAQAILSSLKTQLQLQQKRETQTVASLDSAIEAAEQRVAAEQKAISESESATAAVQAEYDKKLTEENERSPAHLWIKQKVKPATEELETARKRLQTAKDDLRALRNNRESESLRMRIASAQAETEFLKAREQLEKAESELQVSKANLLKVAEQLKDLDSLTDETTAASSSLKIHPAPADPGEASGMDTKSPPQEPLSANAQIEVVDGQIILRGSKSDVEQIRKQLGSIRSNANQGHTNRELDSDEASPTIENQPDADDTKSSHFRTDEQARQIHRSAMNNRQAKLEQALTGAPSSQAKVKAQLLTMPVEVRHEVRRIVAEQKAISTAAVKLRLSGSDDSESGSSTFDAYLNGEEARYGVDPHFGKVMLLEIDRLRIESNASVDSDSSADASVTPLNLHRFGLEPLFMPDQSTLDALMSPKYGVDGITVSYRQQDGSGLAVVKLRSLAASQEIHSEYWLSPEYGNRPVYIKMRIDGSPQTSGLTIEQRTNWKLYDDVWFPAKIAISHQQGYTVQRCVLETLSAKFKDVAFPAGMFSLTQRATEHERNGESPMTGEDLNAQSTRASNVNTKKAGDEIREICRILGIAAPQYLAIPRNQEIVVHSQEPNPEIAMSWFQLHGLVHAEDFNTSETTQRLASKLRVELLNDLKKQVELEATRLWFDELLQNERKRKERELSQISILDLKQRAARKFVALQRDAVKTVGRMKLDLGDGGGDAKTVISAYPVRYVQSNVAQSIIMDVTKLFGIFPELPLGDSRTNMLVIEHHGREEYYKCLAALIDEAGAETKSAERRDELWKLRIRFLTMLERMVQADSETRLSHTNEADASIAEESHRALSPDGRDG